MPSHRRLIIFAASLTILAALAPSADAAGDPEKGASQFNKCRACHRVGPGARNLVGPELNGVVGRKAGSIEGYPYSAAMKASGLSWDETTLTQWLRSPSRRAGSWCGSRDELWSSTAAYEAGDARSVTGACSGRRGGRG